MTLWLVGIRLGRCRDFMLLEAGVCCAIQSEQDCPPFITLDVDSWQGCCHHFKFNLRTHEPWPGIALWVLSSGCQWSNSSFLIHRCVKISFGESSWGISCEGGDTRALASWFFFIIVTLGQCMASEFHSCTTLCSLCVSGLSPGDPEIWPSYMVWLLCW